MFGRMKADAWLEGYDKGMDEAEGLREMEQQSDDNGIAYATQGDYMKAKVAFNAKDTEIASLKNRVKDLEKQIVDSSKTSGNHKAELAKYRKELERFYLEAIGNAKTVKQVKAVMDRYAKSSLCLDQTAMYLRDITCVYLFAKPPQKFNVPSIQQAATTKINRINRTLVIKKCQGLNKEANATVYAMVMMALLKEVANIEVDGTKIIQAKEAGLDPLSVFLSMLSVYGVKRSDILGVE